MPLWLAMRILLKTKPHGSHTVFLVEDAASPNNRIYEIHGEGGGLPLLGSELDSVVNWWLKERERRGQDAPT